jgi:hypothetical protein
MMSFAGWGAAGGSAGRAIALPTNAPDNAPIRMRIFMLRMDHLHRTGS